MIYSSLKAAWHLDRIAALRAGGVVVPAQVQLVLSDTCNQNCHFCAYRMDGGFSTEKFGGVNPKRRIPTEKALEIVRDCATAGVRAIQFTGGGEPTVHPDHVEIIAEAQSLGLKTGLVTNGVLLKPDPAFDAMDWIRVSLDAASPETYEAIRERNHLDKALHGCNSVSPKVLGIGFVVTAENWREIVPAAALAASVGADYIRYSAVFSHLGRRYYDNLDEIRAEIAAARQQPVDVVDLFDARVADLDQGAPDYGFCGYQRLNCYIGGNLKVYRCCTTAYTAHGEVGDLSDKSFLDWLHPYAGFDARTCHHCQFNDKNRLINYLVGAPIHVDFV